MSRTEQEIIIKECSPQNVDFSDNFTLLLNVNPSDIDLYGLDQKAESEGLEKKAEFHLTVLGFKNGSEIKKYLKSLGDPVLQQQKLTEIRDLVDKTDWKFQILPERYRIEKQYKSVDPKTKEVVDENRQSYIQMAKLAAMKDFYRELSIITSIQFEIPPAHITLFSSSNISSNMTAGIGLNSEKDFEACNPQPI